MSPASGNAADRSIRLLVGAALLSASALLATPAPAPAQSRSGIGCELCHGELEFLRAQSGSLVEAQRLLVTSAEVRNSAHAAMDCGDCHSNFDRWPHGGRTATRGCASCHEPQDSLWRHSIHADTTNAEPAGCASCHSIHSVMTVAELGEEAGAGRANARCTECHESARLSPSSPHAQAVLCAGCHAAHDTKRVDDPAARVAPANQYQTCKACHEEETSGWPADAHGRAVLEGTTHTANAEAGHPPAACTGCHGGHDMLYLSDRTFNAVIVERCSTCHEDEAERYLETYHGQASALGSEIVAICSACHGSHDILPATSPASTIAEANLVLTCGACHTQARASFVAYDSHPDPGDRERSGVVYYTFFFMNLLLVGVFSVFGVHTILWWTRLLAGRKPGSPGDGGQHA